MKRTPLWLAGCAIRLLASGGLAQVVEHPVNSPLSGAPRELQGTNVVRVPGRVTPMFWECSITTTDENASTDKPATTQVNCLVPLADVEFIGKQNYIVDGNIEVTEVTASMRSKTFLRFYFIKEIEGAAWQRLANEAARVDDLLSKHTGQMNVTPSMQSPRNSKVVKNYPVTTHAQTVEYRLQKKEEVEELYTSLRDAFFTYKTFDLVESQRGATIISFEANQTQRKKGGSVLDAELPDGDLPAE